MGKGNDAGRDAAAATNAASQRQIDELRRQFDVTQGNIQPFLEAGTGLLPNQVEGSTIGGLDARLGQIVNSDIFGTLVDERTRATQGQLAAGGLTRSGAGLEAIAGIPQDTALMIENLLFGRTADLTGSAQNAAVGLGSLGAQNSQAIGQALAQQGQNTASGILADQQANAQAGTNLLTAGISAASIFFSDPRLKENVEQVGKIKDLNIYEWDWIDAATDTIISACQTIGFMADEVENKYPQHVSEFAGYKVIDYPSLLDELENAYIS